MRRVVVLLVILDVLAGTVLLWRRPTAAHVAAPVPTTRTFPPRESKGGWKTLVPAVGEPDAQQKVAIAQLGVDYDRLKQAWEYNCVAPGPTGLIVIRQGVVVGEWYRGCTRRTRFNIYSSSKSYTSLAYGALLADSEAGKLPGGKRLTLDTRVCTPEWLPQELPLSDPRKAEITLRHLLTMTSGIGPEHLRAASRPFETALGKTAHSPYARLMSAPGERFHYSAANIAHLVLLFKNASGEDLFPYMKRRVFTPIGMERVSWLKVGGEAGSLGPLSQGYSGLLMTPRQHARFCYLALHRGEWDGKRIVPASYYDFAWTGTRANLAYGALWWLGPLHCNGPADMAETVGMFNNNGYVVTDRDLVFVRMGSGQRFPLGFDQQLLERVLAAVR